MSELNVFIICYSRPDRLYNNTKLFHALKIVKKQRNVFCLSFIDKCKYIHDSFAEKYRWIKKMCCLCILCNAVSVSAVQLF